MMFNPEQAREQDPAIRLKRLLEFFSGELRQEQVPVTEDCRIDMRQFTSPYGAARVTRDEKIVQEWQQEWFGNATEEEIQTKKLKSEGERLEMLKTVIFSKNLRENFIVVRSSMYDDIKSGVDNVVIDRKTGDLVCALDEVGDASGPTYEKKKNNVLEKNKSEEKGGATLRYGLTVEQTGGKLSIRLGEITHIPIFYLALPRGYIARGLADLDPSPHQQSDTEERLFKYFMSGLRFQVSDLEINWRRLHPELQKRLERFGQFLNTTVTKQDQKTPPR